jgi:hypothetical protein
VRRGGDGGRIPNKETPRTRAGRHCLPESQALERSTRNLPPGIPDEAVPFLDEIGYLEADTLRVWDPAPDVPLFTPAGEEVRLARLGNECPVVLVFGSYT